MTLNKIKTEKVIILLLLLFIVIQPFLDIYIFFTNPNLEFFSLTIPTIIRCLFLSIMLLLTIMNYKFSKKNLILYMYMMLIIIYSIIHHIVVSKNLMISDNFSYSLFQELFYVFRMLFPYVIIFITKNSKIKKQQCVDILIYTSIIISSVIIISNSLKLSLTSYNGNDLIGLSWFEWSKDAFAKYSFESLASKGWFFMANQVSGLMLLLLPFNIYQLLTKKTKISIISTLMLIISMIMLGTRVAAFGWIIVFFLIIVIYGIILIYNKSITINKKNIINFLIISIIGIAVLINSPIMIRNYEYKVDDPSIPPITIPEDHPSDDVYEYILNEYPKYKIQDVYIKDIYNYQYDPDFWISFMNKSKDRVIMNREVQYMITQRISDRNNELKFQLFGLSFSRMRSGQIYIEKDFLVHYYTMGFLGILLLFGPYFLLLILFLYKMIMDLKKQFNLFNCTALLSIILVFAVGFFSGHIMDELFITIYIGFVFGIIYKNIFDEKGEFDD